jgi:hypothetical protein
MMKLFSRFSRDPFVQMARHRAAADRVALVHLEGLAVKGTINRDAVMKVARTVNRHPDELIEMIPDRRRATRHGRAVEGLRKAGLIGQGSLIRQEDLDDER